MRPVSRRMKEVVVVVGWGGRCDAAAAPQGPCG